jgi:hypothetical protein
VRRRVLEVNSFDGAIAATAFHGEIGVGRGYLAVVEWQVVVPYWLLIAAGGTPGVAMAVWHLHDRRSRLAGGRCPSCGYDLRASLGRCPECGAKPAASACRE